MRRANLHTGLSPGYAQSKWAEQLVRDYNKGDYKWMQDKDKEMVASIAAQYGLDFRAQSKPLRKALFDFADMATFGLLPDEWRPTTIGEEYGFESGADRFAGGIGSLGGLLTPWGGPGLLMRGAGKGARAAKAWWKGGKGGAGGASQAGNKMAQLNAGRDIAQLGQGVPRLGQGAPRTIPMDPRGGYLERTFPEFGQKPTLLGMGRPPRPITTGAGETYDIMRGSRLGTGSMNMSPRTYQDYLDNF